MKLIRQIGFLPFAEGSWRTGKLYSEVQNGTVAMSKRRASVVDGWCTWDGRPFSGGGNRGLIWSMKRTEPLPQPAEFNYEIDS